MDVSILIVNYNTSELLVDCIDSIMSSTKSIEYEIIVVDNASKDNSVSNIKNRFPDVKVISLNENIGFGKANNIGAETAIGEFLFLVNSDMIFTENSVRKMHDFFIKNEIELSLGVLGCKLLDVDRNINNSGGGFPWVKNDLLELYDVVRLRFLKIKKPGRDHYNFNKEYFKIDYVIGADMFLRRNLFFKAGCFDKNYFMYYEEADLQMQITKLGYKNYVMTGTCIVHLEGASSKLVNNKASNFKRLSVSTSRNYYFKKNDSSNYKYHIMIDSLLNLTRLFHSDYTFKENWEFVSKNFKSY